MNNKMQNDRHLGIGGLRRRKGLCRFLASVAAAMFLFISATPAFAAGTDVLGGNAVLTGMHRATLDANGANAAVFSSKSASAVLDWAKFNVGAGQSMSFNGASTTFFNLVDGAAGKSQIDGIINGSGNVWVINPAGIAFGANSSVNVGGLFAAAAGNVENAAALRAGTAMMPEFSSFAGKVDAQGGTFSADRVALLGQMVNVDGSNMKDVGQLAIGAGNGMTVVDDVAEGKVLINVTDFAADADEPSVLLGDLELGGGVDLGYEAPVADRGLSVKSGNGIKVLGNVNTDGNAEFYTRKGDIAVADGGSVNANGLVSEVDMVAGMNADGKGDVIVDGVVKADSGTGYGLETVYAYAGYGSGAVGSEGDVKVNGAIKASGSLDIRSLDQSGSVEIGATGALVSRQEDVKMFAGSSVRSAGAIAAGKGFVYATGHADGVDLNVDDSGLVVAQAVCAQTDGDAAVAVDNPRNIITDLDSCVANSSPQGVFAADPYGLAVDQGMYNVLRDYLEGTVPGNAVIWDDVSDPGSLLLSAVGDMTVLNGTSVSGKAVYLQANGDVNVGAKATLTADGTDALLGSVGLTSMSGKVLVDKGAVVKATAADAQVVIGSYAQDKTVGGVVVNGEIEACTKDHSGNGLAHLSALNGDIDINGNVRADGIASAMVGKISYALDENGNPISDGNGGYVKAGTEGNGSVRVNGGISAVGAPDTAVVMVETVNQGGVEVTERGELSSAGVAVISAVDDVTVGGTVEGDSATLVTSERGGIAVNGPVTSEGAGGIVFLQSGKDIRFTEKGVVRGTEAVDLIAQGDLIQEDAHLPYRDGRLEAVDLRPAASGKEVGLTTGGDIGQGKSNPFVVDGKVYAVSLGDMSLAAGRGHSLEGGNASSKVSVEDSVRFARDIAQKKLGGTVTLEEMLERMANPSDFDDNALLFSEGNMSLYTAGQMEANSFVGAGGDLTVSAAKFGDMSYLNAGGKLTINNVGKPSHPQIAYFESVNGREPRINNQPNDVVIFVDGRLAGGNLQIINKFGATEAFPVATPELKSEQGIFGNPVFMHGDLDVANPMAVGNVDYMLQEIPRLTLASDFPLEIDKSVNTAGLNPKDVYRFGQHPEVAEEKPQAEQEEKKDEKASAEQPAEPKVAMR